MNCHSERLVKNLLAAFLFIFTFYFLLLPSPTLAQAPIPSYVSPASPIYTDLLVHNLFHSFSCLAVGSSVIGKPCLTYQNGIPVLSQVNLQGGALGAGTSLIGLLYKHPPVRTVDYLASVGQGFGFVKAAHAQQRINPQTVITAQAALPGLVIGLVMITFSFFLAGLISDMAYVGTNVVGYYFSIAQRPDKDPQNLVSDIEQQNILSLFTPFTKAVSQNKVKNAVDSIWNNLADPNTNRTNPLDMDPQKALSTLTSFVVSQFIMPFGSMAGGPGQIVAGAISFGGGYFAPQAMASTALSFAAMIILIYAMFRLLLRLINNYLAIIFLTITAPFQFLAAALPGRQSIATGWILNMLANILAFPAVLAVLYFVAFILGKDFVQPPQSSVFIISQLNQTKQTAFTPVAQAAEGKIVEGSTFPLFGGLDLSFIHLLLAFGALMALPAIPDIIARTIGRVGVAGQLIGQELGSSYREGRGYAGQASQGASGIAGQVGRVTDEPAYVWNKASGLYEPSQTHSKGGLGTRIGGGFQSNPIIQKVKAKFK
ncbi:MAG: hypothetical protein US80_C0010G0006 [Candidatus Daviesbacteria bacterium GW2011_GWA2_38_17]|nr:MAG: hypothetical protein US80_C0010G0006 [Candidatus Daviesbacteria bacterium GW2011_GWA2_38_17]